MARGNIRLTLAAGALAAVSLTIFNHGPLGAAQVVLGACEYEDSTWCVWDARTQGNGEGNSFVSFTPDAWLVVGPHYVDGTVYTGADLGYETEWVQ